MYAMAPPLSVHHSAGRDEKAEKGPSRRFVLELEVCYRAEQSFH
jgi:hypothetical protein